MCLAGQIRRWARLSLTAGYSSINDFLFFMSFRLPVLCLVAVTVHDVFEFLVSVIERLSEQASF